MTKRAVKAAADVSKAAEYNIDTAFDIIRTGIANPRILEHIPNGSHIVPIPHDDPEIAAENRKLRGNLASQGQQVVTLHVIVAQVAITPDGGLFFGQTYFTPDEAAEIGAMIQLADRPMPGNIGVEFLSEGQVVALRPLFNGTVAKAVHPLVLEDHPEIPRGVNGSRPLPTHTLEKLSMAIKPALG